MIFLGALLATALLAWFGREPGVRSLRSVAVWLVVAAWIYLGFAVAGGAWGWLAIESVGVVLFSFFAWLGLNRSPLWLVLGWLAHIGWDVGLHEWLTAPSVPEGYPVLCIGFDAVVSLYVFRIWLSSKGVLPAKSRRVPVDEVLQ